MTIAGGCSSVDVGLECAHPLGDVCANVQVQIYYLWLSRGCHLSIIYVCAFEAFVNCYMFLNSAGHLV